MIKLWIFIVLCGLFCLVQSKTKEQQATYDKEVLFSDEEDDDDDNAVFKLPLGEQKSKLKSLVEKKIDANQDGFVDHSELEQWALKAINKFEMDYAKEDFPSVDKDKDGVISWTEYVADTYGNIDENSDDFMNYESETKEWQSIVGSYKKDKLMFEAADQDHDGNLDISEYLFFKHPKLTPDTQSVLIKHALASSDLDKDDAISLSEFLGDYRKNENGADPDWISMEEDKFKHDFDLNRDGKLTGEEILRWIANDNSAEEASEEAEHLFSECDSNGDSKLTVAEILNNHALWLDSDATDYGKQLLQNHDEL